jgi:hypothetical protein
MFPRVDANIESGMHRDAVNVLLIAAATTQVYRLHFKGYVVFVFLSWIPATKFHIKTGKKLTGPNRLLRDGARVEAKYDDDDVLLRRSA